MSKHLHTFETEHERSTSTELMLFCLQTEFYVQSYLLFLLPRLGLTLFHVCVYCLKCI